VSIEVLAPGLSTIVQDRGRPGLGALGVGVGGAADTYSLAVANLLVGNPPGAAALEISLAGPQLRFLAGARIALAGAEVEARCEGLTLPGWRGIDLPAGAQLTIGACRRGARAYLAVCGGIAVAAVLGSRSTDARGGFGGIEGRALRAGDHLPLTDPTAPGGDILRIDRRWVNPQPDLDFAQPALLRFLAGSDALREPASLETGPWHVGASSNRQGVRLTGPALRPATTAERISEPVLPGTVQLPPDGQPIVLGADAQTVGGYPRIGHVIRADWPRLAQLRPGDRLRLQQVDPAFARTAWQQQQARLARIAIALGALA